MDISTISDLATAIFTGIVALLSIHSKFKSKIILLYERIIYTDDSRLSHTDYHYSIHITNRSEKIIKIENIIVHGVAEYNPRFERSMVSPSESLHCGVSFITPKDHSVYFKVKLVNLNKGTLPVYRIEVIKRISLTKIGCKKTMELLKRIQLRLY